MATTPPYQIISTPQTPPTPLHGAAYDRPTRQSARIRQQVALQQAQSTPEPPSRRKRSIDTPAASTSPQQVHFSQSTPKRAQRRVQVISPTSPSTESSPPKPRKSSSHLQPFLSSTTTMVNGIPTPVKTPKKKSNVPNVGATARALFQDGDGEAQLIAPSPRKARKNKRYNGFSLESFSTEAETGRHVAIYTDNQDKIPELDTDISNPFVDAPVNGEASRSKKLVGGTKRRKISAPRRLDPQVEEAINQDEGMVYVFRGKKVYRRFDDTGEEEEELDVDDHGMLGDGTEAEQQLKNVRPLTRKSIKPTRLFQAEIQKRARTREQEEEALTDAEHEVDGPEPASAARTSHGTNKPNLERIEKPKKASPFDSWARVKGSSRALSTTKGQKRSASDALDEPSPSGTVGSPRTRRARV